MNKHMISAIILAASAVSSVAMADGLALYPEAQQAVAGKTRAQVVQEMIAFRSNPVVGEWRQVDSDAGWVYVGNAKSGKPREEVLRELEAFQKDRAAQARFAAMYGNS